MKKLFALALAVPFLASSATAAPAGKIGFIGPKGAQIWNLSSGKIQSIAGGQKADNLAFSPNGDAVFFVPNGKKTPATERLFDTFSSRAPYTRSTPIRAMRGVSPYEFLWSPGGRSLYVNGYQLGGIYRPATSQWVRTGFYPESVDRSGRKFGYCTGDDVIIRDARTGKDRVIFSTKNPKPLYDALRRAKNLKNVSSLLEGESMQKEPYAQWQLAGPVLSPDGTRAYFATNAGTGYGAAGNGMQGYFACDLKSGRISVLSKFGADFGRPPEFAMSPDGKRLLSVTSVHSSAADNSTVVSIIDLETQNMREIMYTIPGSKDRANFYGGSAWSPDGKYVALSGYFYDADKVMDSLGDWEEPPASAWKTAIFEASTGKIWGVKAGMRAPGWSR